MISDCDKRGHDYYLADDPDPYNRLGLIEKCMYCGKTKPVFKKK